MKTFIHIVLVLLCTQYLSCKKDCKCYNNANPACENYNPCAGAEDVKADFRFCKRLGLGTSARFHNEIIFDSVFPVGGVAFWPTTEGADNYTWWVGLDTLKTEIGSRVFDYTTIGKKITVSLVTESKNTAKCFPDKSGRDTVTKNLYIKLLCDLDIWGNYRGLAIGETDSFDFGVLPIDVESGEPNLCDPFFFGSTYFSVSNLKPPYQHSLYRDTFIVGSSAIFSNNHMQVGEKDGNDYEFSGYYYFRLELFKNNTFVMDLKVRKKDASDKNYIQYNIKGRKL